MDISEFVGECMASLSGEMSDVAASSTPAISYVARLLHPRWTRGYAMAGDANHSIKSIYWRERTPDGDFTVYQRTHDGLSREATIDSDDYDEDGLPNTIRVNGRPVYF